MFNLPSVLYVVMPHVEGITLSKLLQENNGRLNEEAIKFITFQLVIAIGDLHSKGIVHRKINLNSIVIESDGYIKITDFHNAVKLNDEFDAIDNPPCTDEERAFRAPEMLNENSRDHNKIVDWWALGILTYVMLCGVKNKPFKGASEKELLKKIKTKQLKFPDEKHNI